MMGRIKMHEFNQEDDEIETEYTAEKQGSWADSVRTYLRKQMPAKLHAVAMTLIPAMKARDSDD